MVPLVLLKYEKLRCIAVVKESQWQCHTFQASGVIGKINVANWMQLGQL